MKRVVCYLCIKIYTNISSISSKNIEWTTVFCIQWSRSRSTLIIKNPMEKSNGKKFLNQNLSAASMQSVIAHFDSTGFPILQMSFKESFANLRYFFTSAGSNCFSSSSASSSTIACSSFGPNTNTNRWNRYNMNYKQIVHM